MKVLTNNDEGPKVLPLNAFLISCFVIVAGGAASFGALKYQVESGQRDFEKRHDALLREVAEQKEENRQVTATVNAMASDLREIKTDVSWLRQKGKE